MQKILIPVLLLVSFVVYGQSPEMKVMNDGILIPQADHTSITTPADGHMVYDETTATFWYYNGTEWLEIGNDMDKDSTNELQEMTVSVEGDTVYLSGGNYIIVPGSSDANYIKDYDGNVYNEVVVGDQVWLLENMHTTHYRDGTPIPKVEDASVWDDYYTSPFDGFCWFDNDSTTYQKFGALYNFGVVDSTVNGNKNICPVGFDVPTQADIVALRQYARDLFGGNAGAIKLKLPPGEYWNPTLAFPFGGPGDNESGFAAVGSGFRNQYGVFEENKGITYFLTRTATTTNNGEVFVLRMFDDDWEADIFDTNRSYGMAIRCIKLD